MGDHRAGLRLGFFIGDLRAEKERLIGETEDQPARSGAKETFTMERTGERVRN